MSKLTLYHNTSNTNAINISKEGVKAGMRLNVYGKGSEAEGSGIWCSTVRGYGYGGATITFKIDDTDKDLWKANDTEYIVYRDIDVTDIIDIDLMISDIPCNPIRLDRTNSTVESDIPLAIQKWGRNNLINIFEKNSNHFVQPYNFEQLVHLIDTGEKYCNMNMKLNESKSYKYDINNLPDNVKQITNMNQFLRDIIQQEPDDYWRAQLEDVYTCGFRLILNPNETPLQRKRHLVQQYLDNKNKIEETLNMKEYGKTKAELIEKVHKLIATYGRKDTLWELAYEFNAIGFYQEDKRHSKLQYIENCINNCYEDNENTSLNREIELAINNVEKILSKQEKITEVKKLEEVSRNELLTRAKQQTITRYNKSVGYKGFSIVDIDTTSVFTTNCFRVTCGVGKYYDTVEMENILYWVQIEAEKDKSRQINSKGVTAAIMNSIDGMDIRIDCSCPDFAYRFAYRATKYKYKYGKPETRPADITNPNEYGALCKHLISMLSNKKWLQQSTSILLDYLIERIDDVNKFLKLSGEDALTVPNELARQNAKKATYSKLFKDVDNEDDVDDIELNSDNDVDEENGDKPEQNVQINKPQGASIKSDRDIDINEEETENEE